MPHYCELITEYADAVTQSTREEYERGELDFLDVEVWRRDSFESRRVEFVLTIGGPTVTITIDEYDNVEIHHSWGCNAIGEPMTDCQLYGSDAELWVELAYLFSEV